MLKQFVGQLRKIVNKHDMSFVELASDRFLITVKCRSKFGAKERKYRTLSLTIFGQLKGGLQLVNRRLSYRPFRTS